MLAEFALQISALADKIAAAMGVSILIPLVILILFALVIVSALKQS